MKNSVADSGTAPGRLPARSRCRVVTPSISTLRRVEPTDFAGELLQVRLRPEFSVGTDAGGHTAMDCIMNQDADLGVFNKTFN